MLIPISDLSIFVSNSTWLVYRFTIRSARGLVSRWAQGRQVDWPFGRWVGGLVSQSAGQPVGHLVSQSDDRSAILSASCWLGLLLFQQVSQLVGRLVGHSVVWSVGRLAKLGDNLC